MVYSDDLSKFYIKETGFAAGEWPCFFNHSYSARRGNVGSSTAPEGGRNKTALDGDGPISTAIAT
jgi:hypothetical protein